MIQNRLLSCTGLPQSRLLTVYIYNIHEVLVIIRALLWRLVLASLVGNRHPMVIQLSFSIAFLIVVRRLVEILYHLKRHLA